MDRIQIGNRFIGEGCPAYLIAEMSANHAGSLERAREIIHAAKESGADCIKVQTYTPDTLTIDCSNQYFQVKNGTWEGENLYQLYGKGYMPWEWQPILKEEAEKVGIDFLSTAFDRTSVDFLEEMGLEFYKIASFEMPDLPLVEYVASKGKPVILSTGMGTLEEIREAVAAVRKTGNSQLALLKCSSLPGGPGRDAPCRHSGHEAQVPGSHRAFGSYHGPHERTGGRGLGGEDHREAFLSQPGDREPGRVLLHDA